MMLTCGFDEAGRGPLAGPVTAGCVILPADFPVKILNDSKKLSEKKRVAAEAVIKERALWGLGIADHKTIDAINILQATMLAMRRAYDQMMTGFDAWCAAHGITPADASVAAIVDGTTCPDVPCECRAEPKADGTYPAVMAASIIAKVARDRIMQDYDRLYPAYGYARHKGYPTAEHRRVCHEIGPSPIQRLSFSF
ncbi:MAG: ribonuclease HII [Treponemataceae bacterium]|nr:ribonuclease HII [Treponemataceae bacterium]